MTTVARFSTVGTLIIRDLGKTVVSVVEVRHTCLSSLSRLLKLNELVLCKGALCNFWAHGFSSRPAL